MDIWILIVLILIGLFLLKKGADWFVDGARALARRFGVSELAIGLTVVAFGTSAPELVVNSFGSVKGNYDVVFGNIIGSNLFNLFIILSIIGLIYPLKVQSSTAWKEIPISFAAIVILFLLVQDGILFKGKESVLSRFDALIMLAAFSLFIYYVFRQLKNDPLAKIETTAEMTATRMVILIIIGLTGLVVGGKLVLDNSVKMALQMGISEKIIGLTIVAAGTSLPELATSVVAVMKRNQDIAVGNIIGSNIFNILFILPVSALLRPLEYNQTFNSDIYFLAGGTILLFVAMYTGKKQTIDRWEALFLLVAYVIYILLLI